MLDLPHPLGFVQFLQYYYQSGCLYRLRALGERHTMDLTVGESAGPAPQPGEVEGRGFPEEGIHVSSLATTAAFLIPPVEGFQSWMWRGLTFLLPFLFFGHVSHTRVPSSTTWVSSASGSEPH